MATAKQKLAPLPWAPEGRHSLGVLIERLVGGEHWSILVEMCRHFPAPIIPGQLYEPLYDSRWAAAMRACGQLVDAWNAGDWIAEGRRRDPLAPHEEIAPPRVGWTLVVYDFERSTIGDPTATRDDPAKIYDLHFTPRGVELTGAAVWAVPEAKRLKAAGKIFKTKTAFAKEIVKASENANSAKPVGHLHIYNNLDTWRIWPINSIK